MPISLEEQYDKIYKYCYFKVKNSQLAEDLTQEAFLRFFSQNSYMDRGKPLAYLYSIAKNLCIDAYRRPAGPALPEDVACEDVGLNTVETRLDLGAALAALPGEVQEILLLRYANELSMKEICAITGLSRFALRRRINEGLEKLRGMLKEDFS